MRKILLALCFITVNLLAERIELNGVCYYIDTANKTACVTNNCIGEISEHPNHGEITIPSSVIYDGSTYPVTEIGRYAFFFCRDLNKVALPETVTKISEGAFEGCVNLRYIYIPKSVISIGEKAFSGCSSLSDIYLQGANPTDYSCSYNAFGDKVEEFDESQQMNDIYWDVVDLSSAWDDATIGGIAYQTGKLVNNNNTSDLVCTPYIPCKNYSMLYVPGMPSGRTLGTCFYDEQKNAIPYVEGMKINGNAAVGVVRSVVNDWMLIPQEAAYFRTTKLNVDDTTLKAIQYSSSEHKGMPLRNSNLLFSMDDFDGITEVGQQYTQADEDYCARQISGRTFIELNRFRFEALILAGKDLKASIGFENFLNTVELVLSGSTVEISYHTASNTSNRIGVISEPLGFNIVKGGLYRLSITRLDNSTEKDLPKYGAIFQVENLTDGTTWRKVVKRAVDDTNIYNGVASNSFCVLGGIPFISVKAGTASVYAINVKDSDHLLNPEVVMFGDSYSQGTTLIGNNSDNMQKRYSALLEEAVGHGNFVLTGMGGDYFRPDRMLAIMKFCRLYRPKYVFIQGSVNAETKPGVPNIQIELFKYMVSWLRQHDIIPILSTIPTAYYNSSEGLRKEFKEAFNAYVRNCGEKYIDFEKVLLSVGEFPNEYYLPDKIHPTAGGHAAIFKEFQEKMPELFENNSAGESEIWDVVDVPCEMSKATLCVPKGCRALYEKTEPWCLFTNIVEMNIDRVKSITNSQEQRNTFYNLKGQCVKNPMKGVYINSGKKVIVK